MDGATEFRSAQGIYADLRTAGNAIGLATVYRALQGMVEDGEVDVLRTAEDGEAVYRRCSTGHHHHLVCRTCGVATEIEGAAAERWAQAIAAEHGFTAVSHVLEVFGTCATCGAAQGGLVPHVSYGSSGSSTARSDSATKPGAEGSGAPVPS